MQEKNTSSKRSDKSDELRKALFEYLRSEKAAMAKGQTKSNLDNQACFFVKRAAVNILSPLLRRTLAASCERMSDEGEIARCIRLRE